MKLKVKTTQDSNLSLLEGRMLSITAKAGTVHEGVCLYAAPCGFSLHNGEAEVFLEDEDGELKGQGLVGLWIGSKVIEEVRCEF